MNKYLYTLNNKKQELNILDLYSNRIEVNQPLNFTAIDCIGTILQEGDYVVYQPKVKYGILTVTEMIKVREENEQVDLLVFRNLKGIHYLPNVATRSYYSNSILKVDQDFVDKLINTPFLVQGKDF